MSDTTCGYPGCVNGYVRAVFGPVPCFACNGAPATRERPERPAVALDPVSAANGVLVHPPAVSSCTAPACVARVTALDSRLATAEQEAAKWKGLVFSPLGDNHHNAAACPYCSPTLEADRAATAERIRTAEASRARAEQETATLRKEWWLAHGFAWHGSTAALYGDDGEMSCNACGIDFKREPVEQIKARLMVKSLAGATVEPPERPDATATEGAPESVDLAVDQGARTAQRLPSRSSPDAVSPDPASTSALRPDETPRSGT